MTIKRTRSVLISRSKKIIIYHIYCKLSHCLLKKILQSLHICLYHTLLTKNLFCVQEIVWNWRQRASSIMYHVKVPSPVDVLKPFITATKSTSVMFLDIFHISLDKKLKRKIDVFLYQKTQTLFNL